MTSSKCGFHHVAHACPTSMPPPLLREGDGVSPRAYRRGHREAWARGSSLGSSGWPSRASFTPRPFRSPFDLRVRPRFAAWSMRWTSTKSPCSASRSAQGEPQIRPRSRSTGTRTGSFAWNRIARKVSGRLSLPEHARLYAALNAAISDTHMTSLESKFFYNLWRPLTAIRAADTDGNPLTVADDTWEPAFVTPPVPDYPSGHSAAGAAAAEVIDAFVGRGRFFHARVDDWTDLWCARCRDPLVR
jgi:hypothetical protein